MAVTRPFSIFFRSFFFKHLLIYITTNFTKKKFLSGEKKILNFFSRLINLPGGGVPPQLF